MRVNRLRNYFFMVIAQLSSALALNNCFAIDYFFSVSTGRDFFDGKNSEQNGSSGPFASLSKIQKLNLQNGDRLYLKCGDHFYDTVKINLPSNTNAHIKITSYGDCSSKAHPIIDGRVPLNVSSNGKLQKFKENQYIEQIFTNDQPLAIARAPSNTYYLIRSDSLTSTNDISSDWIALNYGIAGSRLHARTQEWFLEERQVIDDAGHLDTPLLYPLKQSSGYYLTGKDWMIGNSYSWSYDSSLKEIAIQAPINTHLFKVPTGNLLEVTGNSNVTISGLHFLAAGSNAIHAHVEGSVEIHDVDIQYASGNGISIRGTKNASINSSIISDVGNDAIFFAEVKNATVKHNIIRNSGMYNSPRPSLASINAHRTEGALIMENSINNSAYHAIRVSGNAKVMRNFVRNSCQILSDCAAIYTWRRNSLDIRPSSEIAGNIILNVGGDTSVKFWVEDWYAGIYLDEYSNNILVRNNIVIGANQGVYLHNAFNNIVRNNYVKAITKTIIQSVDSKTHPKELLFNNLIYLNSEELGKLKFKINGISSDTKPLDFDKPSSIELSKEVGQKCSSVISFDLLEKNDPGRPLTTKLLCN